MWCITALININWVAENGQWQLLKKGKLRQFSLKCTSKINETCVITCIMNWGEYIVITDINTKYRICWGPISPIWEKTWSILSFCFILAIWDHRFCVEKLSIVFSRPRLSYIKFCLSDVTSMFQKSKHNRYQWHFATTYMKNCLFFNLSGVQFAWSVAIKNNRWADC